MAGMSESNDKQIRELRSKIDHVDLEIREKINQRAKLACNIARAKEKHATPGEEQPLYRPEREAQVLRGVVEGNEGPIDDKSIALIFREIMSACLALERPLTAAYLGPKGTFTQGAVLKHFGHAVTALPMHSISDVFAQVESGDADYGVVPVENSTEGVVNHTLDSFMNSPLVICGEVLLDIRLHLMAHRDAKPEHIKRICAHQQALAQCRRWLELNYTGTERLAVQSNGEAARRSAELAGYAAVASEAAAEVYGLQIIARDIQDRADNATRFLVIGRQPAEPSGTDKCSILVSVKNEPGALYRILEPFHRKQVMLTRLDTRPSRDVAWNYVFFIEFQGHETEQKISAALSDLQEIAVALKRLGSYPQAAF